AILIAQAPAQPRELGLFAWFQGCEPTHLLRQEARWQSRRLPTCCASSAGRRKRHSPSALPLSRGPFRRTAQRRTAISKNSCTERGTSSYSAKRRRSSSAISTV